MICPQCGVLLPENIAACGQCGFAFRPSACGGEAGAGPATGPHGSTPPPAFAPASSGETATVFVPSPSGPASSPSGPVHTGAEVQATVFDLPLTPEPHGPAREPGPAPHTGFARQEKTSTPPPDVSRPLPAPAEGMVHGWLVALSGPDLGRDFRIGPERPRMVIGRTPGPGVLDLRAEGVEEFHALLLFDGRELTVADLDSAGGVLVNGRAERRAPLADGDELSVGRARLRFRAFRS